MLSELVPYISIEDRRKISYFEKNNEFTISHVASLRPAWGTQNTGVLVRCL